MSDSNETNTLENPRWKLEERGPGGWQSAVEWVLPHTRLQGFREMVLVAGRGQRRIRLLERGVDGRYIVVGESIGALAR